ncbi:amylo-alpha-1,6-glucosidase [Roseomonas sp. GC11]|uniref:amylo-alpha-1,6-glucosidase n=1 Tax=Roseomonas sp. GC11 TaxID=2950546 RepID=UPI00210D2F50|nr:glycogen debranching N-terminal domain-containing protein [Roseomonas sp. GC11]MCQ4160344.1 amylo-alpha-1,6-glucosidase [Roseomonas sp. GC11]
MDQHAPATPPEGTTPEDTTTATGTASLQEGRSTTLKHGDSFALADHAGDLTGGAEGLYHGDTRHLSRFSLLLNGQRPLLLSASLLHNNAALSCDLTNPELPALEPGGAGVPDDRLHLRRSRFLWQGAWYERLALRNFDQVAHRLRLELRFAADFADLFEARGARRPRRGLLHRPGIGVDGITLAYTGLDHVLRQTRLRLDPAPSLLEGHRAVWELDLAPGARQAFFFEIRCAGEGRPCAPRLGFGQALREGRRWLRQDEARRVHIASSNDIFDEAIRRSGADLAMLVTETPHGPYPYAGIPWYSTAFGRDALIAAWHTLWYDPAIARGVLRFLAAHQATTTDPATDAEPGKILHETRQGEMALLGEVPFRRYYGSADSTPLFVMLAGAYLDRSADVETLRDLWPSIAAALRWIETEGDADGDGFQEYRRKRPDGLLNQGWKDSHDAIFHADGSTPEGPIALVELQAYAYAAWRAAARILRALGRPAEADAYDTRAERLAAAFDAAFWDEALGTYVLALDGAKRPCRVRASNAGHALFAGIARPERAERVARTLMDPSFFTGWGIRTIASGEARYNPMSYHNGSVWPHDNALIAEGFARYGLRAAAAQLFSALFDAAAAAEQRRLPELFCGFPRRRGQGPVLYPVACSPQAWAATTPLALLRACLGLGFDPAGRCVTFEQPVLPPFLRALQLRNLRLGEGHLDVGFQRVEGEVAMHVLGRSGGVKAVLRSS